ncbi:MAG: hypothetical protein ACRELY_06340 [Polyangiaceae bacterium]
MRLVFLVLAVALLGCPPASGKSSGTSTATTSCTKFGDTCEFSPGKLGSCVHKDDCNVEPCLVCQSQH